MVKETTRAAKRPPTPVPPQIKKAENNTYRARKAKDASQQKAVDDACEELVDEKDKTVELEQEIADLKKEVLSYKRQIETINTERIATVTIDVNRNVEVVLDGQWRLGDIRYITRAMARAIRLQNRQEILQAEAVRAANEKPNRDQLKENEK